MGNTKTYIGYVVGKDETNPYSVWIPAKNGASTLGITKGLGSNTGNKNMMDLANMILASEKCYFTSEMTSQPPYLYDSSNGFATREDNIAVLDENTAKNVKGKDSAPNRYSMPRSQ